MMKIIEKSNQLKNTVSRKGGFTVVELLVVIAIIAVLAAIVLVNVTQYTSRGRDTAAISNLATILVNGAVFYDGASNYSAFTPGSAVGTGTSPAGTTPCVGGAVGYINPCSSITTSSATAGYTITYACGTSTGAQVACNGGTTVQKYCASIVLKNNLNGSTNYCVDSSGQKANGKTCNGAAGTSGTCV